MGGRPVGYLHNAVEELNSGLPRTNPDSSRVKDLNQGPPDFKSIALNHSATLDCLSLTLAFFSILFLVVAATNSLLTISQWIFPELSLCVNAQESQYPVLVYTTQVNSTFRARWLASSEVISHVLFTSEQPTKNKMAFVGILSQIKFLFGPLVIQLVWYILKQLFTTVSVKVVDIYLAAAARQISTTIHLHFGE